MNIDQLQEKLFEIKQEGYVVSLRRGNTGIGYTLETLLELEENNLKTPDLGTIEIKTQRKEATNRVTMFTFNRGVWQLDQKELIEEYGYVDKKGRPSLYCTVNSKPNNQGLYLKVAAGGLELRHIEGTLIAYWDKKDLIGRFEKKMPALVIVYADTRINSDRKEEFWFNEARFVRRPDVENFWALIRRDRVVVDIRMHLRDYGAVRNHGTAFRIEEKFLNLCFEYQGKIL